MVTQFGNSGFHNRPSLANMLHVTALRNVIIVGASLAGLRGAEELRRAGHTGALTLVGAETHFPPFDRPPLSKEVLSGKWTEEEARLRPFEEIDAELVLGTAAIGLDLDSNTLTLSNGEKRNFDDLMIATGTSVRPLPCPGGDLPGVVTIRSIEDCRALEKLLESKPRVAAIGAGFIGSEIAAVCRQRDLDVTLADFAEVPLSRQLGGDIASRIMQRHRDEGVDLVLGVGVEAVLGTDRVEAVKFTDGREIPAEVVVAGVGVLPATGWLEGSGIDIDGGVMCDAFGRVGGRPHVVAAGDVSRWFNPAYGRALRVEHWTNAVEQAEHAARTLMGQNEQPYTAAPYFWSDQYDMHLQFAGVAGSEQVLVEGSFDEGRWVVECRQDDRIVGVVANNWVARFMKRRRMINEQNRAALTL
ncbi:NAD(P)/FAD-dependent oxidoreductase [Nocardia pseudovaccinii]|uniref:NAD(P)/FAD-dependent oxidoreductase n=1 Tax=Nocardia pseudovaccinii TaxID=189540 RepID=UPI003D9394C0